MAATKVPGIHYVSDLDTSVTEADLYSAFKDFAATISFLVIHSRPKSLSFAEVRFTTSEAAQSARRALNGALVNGLHITITDFKRKYQKEPAFNLYVQNFPQSVTNRDLELEFAPCGEIFSTKVVYDKAGNCLRYGFIQFETAEAIVKALAKNGQEWMGEELKVEPFVPLEKRCNFPSKSNLHISGFKEDVTKADLDALFSTFGEIKSSVVQYAPGQVEKNCYGFVEFKEENSTEAALKALNGYEALGGVLKVAPYMRKSVRQKLLQSQYQQKQAEWKRTNLVFSKLPLSMSEDQLREMCQNFGQITSVKVQIKGKTANAVGFVNFENAESADRAQKALNRSKFEGKGVFVNHWMPREEFNRHLRTIRARKQHSKT